MFATPDFIVVGPKKTGTSWLYAQLCQVRGINLPPFKELSFFYDADREHSIQSLRQLLRIYKAAIKNRPGMVPANFEQRIEAWISQVSTGQREKRKRHFHTTWKQGKYLWTLLFYLMPRGLSAWQLFLYTLLFFNRRGGISGDISPEYFSLRPAIIRRIRKYFPRVKIIFIIREPAEREWSQIKMTYYQNKYETPAQSMDERLKKPHSDSDYKNAIENWESHFDREQILYLFYDGLKEDPRLFVEQVLAFLNCPSAVEKLIVEKVGEGLDIEQGEGVKAQLLAKNLSQYEYLAAKFGESSPPARWLKSVMNEK